MVQSLTHGIQRTGADIAEHHADGPEHESPELVPAVGVAMPLVTGGRPVMPGHIGPGGHLGFGCWLGSPGRRRLRGRGVGRGRVRAPGGIPSHEYPPGTATGGPIKAASIYAFQPPDSMEGRKCGICSPAL